MGHHHNFSWSYRKFKGDRPMRIGIGGPVGSGKTALVRALSEVLRDKYKIGVITNDIYTKEDEQILKKSGVLPSHHIIGVETGGCPHTAIREDVSMNFEAVEELTEAIPDLHLIFIESGGDNLAAAFSPELADVFLYIIDVAQGDDIPRKGGPGIKQSDVLIVNKVDLAPHVRVNLNTMKEDCRKQRENKLTVFTNVLSGEGVTEIAEWLAKEYQGRREEAKR
ncbi:urease accessory protein UreG [Pseudobacillus wudalianchiensis]|uniref:Urease accessory protein UreG n=1 Tax=Pseudobacillus wudalianchiensis TaxID=1743143 RepID=A0A1B9AE94_9BACI|nr:urease accessory protein UreG [Bacillus wudalianchiensis]OCA82150.1 urease accessory protein UreG [Bacillus wudalianchiensis]